MDFFAFRKLASVQLISFVWVAGSLLITCGGLIFLLENKPLIYPFTASGVIVIIFGNIVWRMWCELIILLVRISRSLARIELNTSHELSDSRWMN